MANTGRPKVEIDLELLKDLCEIQCTQAEICGILRVTEKTLRRCVKDQAGTTFSLYYKEHSSEGKRSLRRALFHSATVKYNPATLIFLGKSVLGMKEQKEITAADIQNLDIDLIPPEIQQAIVKNFMEKLNERLQEKEKKKKN